MAMAGSPRPGRPVTGVTEAARILRRDVRTVRRMIEAGELEGGATPGPQRRQWFVYTDQLPPFAAAATALASPPEHGELAALRAENADLRARTLAAEEGERLLLAGQAALRDALQHSQSTIATMLAAGASVERGVDGYRAAADGYRNAAEEFRQGADEYRQVAGQAHATVDMLQRVLEQYSDTIAQHITPGHAGSLET